ncbi:MAG TPA: efflux RND transporter periplasmic adaptor subunit [Caulobacteraceae bacterium]|nr:efflux RND transporter periplasmic adaptor subunit [Caulobacteraceae bacterium]
MAAPRRRFRWGFAVAGIVLLALIAWIWVSSHQPPKQPPRPTPAVSVAQATLQDVPITITGLGAAQAWKSDIIRSQVNGKLLAVYFQEGSPVHAGQLLAQVDPAPFQAALTQAEGALRRDEAVLENARLDLKRFQLLAAQDSIARQQLDTQAAVVKQDEGTVMLDRGAVQAAQVNLRWTRITSPIDGRAGVRQVDPGNLVSISDQNGIVIVNQLQPIAVTFTVPQGSFQQLSDASNGFRTPLATEALSQDTGEPLGQGELSIADNKVDPATGTVELKAKFPNDGDRLLPGQYVNVRLTLSTLSQVVAIPATAVNQGPRGTFAYVVGPDSKVQMRPIVVATTQGDSAVIQSGLRAGETVVTDGQMQLRPGIAVRIAGAPPGGRPNGGRERR